MASVDTLIQSFESHCHKLFNRLDNAYMDIELKDYCGALLAARQLLGSLVALRKEISHADAGSAARGYEAAFKNAARRGEKDTGDPDAAAIKRAIWADHPDLHVVESQRADAGDTDSELSDP